MHIILLASLIAMATAMPSYIAVPADQIAFVDLTALRARRVPRQTLSPPPLPNLYSQDYQPVPLQQYQHDTMLHRVPRQTFAPPPQPIFYRQQYQPAPLQYEERPSGLTALEEQDPPAPVRLVRLQQPHDATGAASLGAGPQQAAERPPDFGEYVDFGAHTGDNGAFGWYADFPVNNQEEHSAYRK